MTEYQKFLLNNAVIKSGMLGEFSLEQKYILPKNVINELIRLKKLIVQFRENEIRCVTKVGENTFNFVINIFEDIESKKRYASLYLEEKYKFMNKDNVQQTFLLSFADNSGSEYIVNLKKAFNLTTKDETDGKDISEESKILEELIKSKKDLAKAMPGLVVLDDKAYVLEVLKMLKTTGAFGLRIQGLFKEGMEKIKVDKNSPQYWIALKALLDSLLFEYVKDCKDEEFKKWLEIVNQNYIMIYMNKQKNISKPKVEQKAEKKSKSAPAKKSEPISLGKPKKGKDKPKAKDKGKKNDSAPPKPVVPVKKYSSVASKRTTVNKNSSQNVLISAEMQVGLIAMRADRRLIDSNKKFGKELDAQRKIQLQKEDDGLSM